MTTPPVRVEDRDGSSQMYLWNIQKNSARRMARPRVDAIFSTDSDETFLASYEEEERIQIEGTATGLRIAQRNDYSDDPLEALGEWGSYLLSHVNGNQGRGWTFTNEYTGRSLPGVFESVDLVRRRAEPYQVEYSITVRIGNGLMPEIPPEGSDVTPRTDPTVDGENLHEIESLRINKRQKMNVHKYPFHDPEDNDVEADTGARKEIEIRGNVPGDESVRTDFDSTFRERAGVNEIVEYRSSFPGTTLDVMVGDFESTREAGVTQLGGYALTLIEGVNN